MCACYCFRCQGAFQGLQTDSKKNRWVHGNNVWKVFSNNKEWNIHWKYFQALLTSPSRKFIIFSITYLIVSNFCANLWPLNYALCYSNWPSFQLKWGDEITHRDLTGFWKQKCNKTVKLCVMSRRNGWSFYVWVS